MTNVEVQTNSHQEMEAFVFDLSYEKTEWGRFYDKHKTYNQNQLQKYLLKTENERRDWKKKIGMCRYQTSKICQHIFKYTHYNAEKAKNETPSILLLQSKKLMEQYKISNKVFIAYWKRQQKQLEEVKTFYESRKEELSVHQKVHRREHANEVIECPRCQTKVSRTGMSKHRKTGKCLSTQSQDIQETLAESFIG